MTNLELRKLVAEAFNLLDEVEVGVEDSSDMPYVQIFGEGGTRLLISKRGGVVSIKQLIKLHESILNFNRGKDDTESTRS